MGVFIVLVLCVVLGYQLNYVAACPPKGRRMNFMSIVLFLIPGALFVVEVIKLLFYLFLTFLLGLAWLSWTKERR